MATVQLSAKGSARFGKPKEEVAKIANLSVEKVDEFVSSDMFLEVGEIYMKDHERGQRLTSEEIWHLLTHKWKAGEEGMEPVFTEVAVPVGKKKMFRKQKFMVEKVYENKANALPHTRQSVSEACALLAASIAKTEQSQDAWTTEERALLEYTTKMNALSNSGAVYDDGLVGTPANQVPREVKFDISGMQGKQYENGILQAGKISDDGLMAYAGAPSKFRMLPKHGLNERSIVALANSGMRVHEIHNLFEKEDLFKDANNTYMKVRQVELPKNMSEKQRKKATKEYELVSVKSERILDKLADTYTRREIGRILREAQTDMPEYDARTHSFL